MSEELKKQINLAWENRASLSPKTNGKDRDAIEASIAGLDNGSLQVASRSDGGQWVVNQWIKKAVLLGFRIHPNIVMDG